MNTYTRKTSSVKVTKAFTGLDSLPAGFKITNDFDDELEFKAEDDIVIKEISSGEIPADEV